MTTTTKNITAGQSLIALTEKSASTSIIGSEIDVTGVAAMVHIHFARNNTTAPTAGVNFRIEACPVSTGTLGANAASQWYPVGPIYTTGVTAAVASVPSSVSGAAITVAAGGASFTGGMVAMISSNSTSPTLSNTEWVRILSGATTLVTAEESLKNAYSTGDIWSQAEMVAIPIDISAIGRLRLVADGSLHNATYLAEAYLVTLDSFTNV
jgi:hypothetical protein